MVHAAIFFVIVTSLLPSLAQAQAVCTGLGDNLITLGGKGTVQVACSKYETPGGGTTKFQMPDGTMCAFENMSPNNVQCGGAPGTPTKQLSQDDLGGLVKDIQGAYAAGKEYQDIASLIHKALASKMTYEGSSIIGGAFDTQEYAVASEVGVAEADTIHSAIVQIAETPQRTSTSTAPRPRQIALISNPLEWAFLREDVGDLATLAQERIELAPLGSAFDTTFTPRAHTPSPCDLRCAFARAIRRGDITVADIALPFASAAIAAYAAHFARPFPRRKHRGQIASESE